MNAIKFDGLESCNQFKESMLQRVPHQPAWIPFEPIQLKSGKWIATIADSLRQFLTSEELDSIVTVDPSEITDPRN